MFWDNVAVLDNQTDGFLLEFTPMSYHNVFLVVHGLLNNEFKVLDDCARVAKDEINSARYDTISVELSMGLNMRVSWYPSILQL